jgi:hypothetical protein
MAVSTIVITPQQMRGFTAAMLHRVAAHAGAFLKTHDGRSPPPDTLDAWTWEAVEAGFEVTEDIARFLVLKARCDSSLFRSVMIEPDAEPVLRLIHMEAQHPDVWKPMVGDLV